MKPLLPLSLLAQSLCVCSVIRSAQAVESATTHHPHLRARADPPKPKNVTYADFEAIEPLDEMLPSGPMAQIYKQYQPYLNIVDGCVPYPAIDAKGRANSGLAADSPPPSDKKACAHSKGQTYVRSKEYKKLFAVMYSWYMPRDVTWTETLKEGAGHRHEWENVVVWLKEGKPDAKIVGVALSAHGGFEYFEKDEVNFAKKTHVLVNYDQPIDNVRNHQLRRNQEDGDKGKLNPLVAWESLTPQLRKVLNTRYTFGGTTSGIRDQDFNTFLKLAFISEASPNLVPSIILLLAASLLTTGVLSYS